jgi:hypothetical protein
VTLPARKVTTRLINGEVIFRTGKVNSRDQSEGTIVRLFEGGLAGNRLFSFDFDETTPLRISLLDEITFHTKTSFIFFDQILSHVISSLQEKIRLWYTCFKFDTPTCR